MEEKYHRAKAYNSTVFLLTDASSIKGGRAGPVGTEPPLLHPEEYLLAATTNATPTTYKPHFIGILVMPRAAGPKCTWENRPSWECSA